MSGEVISEIKLRNIRAFRWFYLPAAYLMIRLGLVEFDDAVAWLTGRIRIQTKMKRRKHTWKQRRKSRRS